MDSENKDQNEFDDDQTLKIEGQGSSEGTSDQDSESSEMDNEATLINDPDETTMGDLPDVEMLSLGARLIIVSNQDTGKELYLSKQETTVGRSDENILVMNYPGVSRTHFRLELKEGKIWLTDLGSKYGTILDGQRISEPQPLNGGEKIQAGELVLQVEIGEKKSGLPINQKPVLIAAAAVFIIIVLALGVKLISSKPSPTNTMSSREVIVDVSKEIKEAMSFASSGKLEMALTILDKALNKDPNHSQAKSLQKKWRKELSEQQLLIDAENKLKLGDLEGATVLVQKILNESPENLKARDIYNQIATRQSSKKASNAIEKVSQLISEEKFIDAKLQLEEITNSALKKDKEALIERIEKAEAGIKIYNECLGLFKEGSSHKAKEKIKVAIKLAPNKKRFLTLEKKIEKVLQLQLQAKEAKEGQRWNDAEKALRNILEICEKESSFYNHTENQLKELLSRGLIDAHKKYQKALLLFNQSRYKDAINILDELTQKYPEHMYFQETKNEFLSRVDNVAQSLYRAGYVLEAVDGLKAREIFRKLVVMLPKNHPYAIKARTKIR